MGQEPVERMATPLAPLGAGSIGPRPEPSGAGAERLASTWNGGSPIHMNRIHIIDKPYGFLNTGLCSVRAVADCLVLGAGPASIHNPLRSHP